MPPLHPGLLARSKPRGASRRSAKNVTESTAVYEGASHTRRTLGWRAPTVSPNAALLPTLSTLRDRARAAVRNDGYAKGAIDKLVTNLVGTGIKPLSKADDAAFRATVQRVWLAWTDESDADGLLDWYGQQRQIARTWLEAGEVFVRLRLRRPEDGLTVPLQIQVVEPEQCPHTYNAQLSNGQHVRAGIQFDAIGRRVAYWFHPSRAGDLQDFDAGQLRPIAAESVIHLYDPLRPGQLRGMPHLTQALIRLHELDKYDDAVLLRQQLANLFVAFLTRQPVVAGETVLDPLTGLAKGTGDRPALSLEPGIFQELDSGEDVTFSKPPDIQGGYKDFVRQQLFHIASATGVPYEVLTGDLSGLNDRTVRVVLHEFRRFVIALQHQILSYQLCRRVWDAWMDRAFLSGALPLPAAYADDPLPWARVKWMPQGWPYLHPVQDVKAAQDAIRAGFTSRSAVVSEQGEDAEEIDREQAADNVRADGLDLSYDSDARDNVAPPPAA